MPQTIARGLMREHRHRLRVFQIQRNALLAAVGPDEMRGEAARAMVVGARKIAASGALDLDHARAVVRQMAGGEWRGDRVLQGDDDNAVQWSHHFDSGNERAPGMVKGCCAASGAVKATIFARAASTRPGQAQRLARGMVGFTKTRISALICAVRPRRKAGFS